MVPPAARNIAQPLDEKDFFSSDDEMYQVFEHKRGRGHATSEGSWLKVEGLADDATPREVHVLFSGCPGYLQADVALDERTQRPLGVVRFDKSENAALAAQSRKGTTWATGNRPVLLGALGPDVAAKLLARDQDPLELSLGGAVKRRSSMKRASSHSKAGRVSFIEEASRPARGRSTSPGPAAARMESPSSMPATSAPPAAIGSPPPLPPPDFAGGFFPRGRTPDFAAGGPRPEPSPPGALGSLPRPESPSAGAAAAGRTAYRRQLLAKVEAAAATRKMEDLEALLGEATAAGLDEEDLRGARVILAEFQVTAARRRAVFAETRAKARLGRMLSGPVDEAFKTQAAVEACLATIRSGYEAVTLLGDAGLRSKEAKLRAQTNHVANAWRCHCVGKLQGYLDARDLAAIRLVLPECEVAGLEQTQDSRAVLSSAQRVVGGISEFSLEERFANARFQFNQAMVAKSAPALRHAIAVMEQVGLEDFEIEPARKAYREAQQKVAARWGLMVAMKEATNSGDFLHQAEHIALMKEATAFAQKVNLAAKHYETHLGFIRRYEQMEAKARLLHDAMGNKDIAHLEQAIRDPSGYFPDSKTQALLRRAQTTLEVERTKALTQRRLEATMAGRKTVLLRALPDAITEAESVGLRQSILVRAQDKLSEARLIQRLEEAVKSQEVWVLRSAIDEAKANGLDPELLRAAEEALKEAEARAAINFAIQRGDRGALAKATAAWDLAGYDRQTLQMARSVQRSLEARAEELTKRLAELLATPLAFDEFQADISISSMPLVQELAKVLMKYPDLAIDIDAHGAAKNERAGVKLSQERADSVAKVLQSMGVTNKIMTKGWGSSHPQFKRKLVRISPH